MRSWESARLPEKEGFGADFQDHMDQNAKMSGLSEGKVKAIEGISTIEIVGMPPVLSDVGAAALEDRSG